jgi:Domain of unknown function (DUF4365)
LVGVDVTITGLVSPGERRRTRLDLQLKCTSQNLLDNDGIRFPLEIKNYNELRNTNPSDDPLLLIIILVPEKVEDWLQQSETEQCLKRCAYWVSLRGQPETTNQTTVQRSRHRRNNSYSTRPQYTLKPRPKSYNHLFKSARVDARKSHKRKRISLGKLN